jgi:hypothetical protein
VKHFNEKAYGFIKKLGESKLTSTYDANKPNELYGLGPTISLGEVSNLRVTRFDEATGDDVAKYKDVGGHLIGFHENDYPDFANFILEILETPMFSDKTDFATLFDFGFEWIIGKHTNEIQEELIPYLANEVYTNTKNFQFFFKVNYLAFEKIESITVGNVTILFLDEKTKANYFLRLEETIPEINLEKCKEDYEHIFSVINAIIKVRSVKSKALQIAKDECQLAISTLKCFCTDYAASSQMLMFDLDFNADKPGFSTYMYLEDDDISKSMLLHDKARGKVPVVLGEQFLKFAKSNRFELFSNFIKSPRKTELYHGTLRLIHQLGDIVSTYDDYEKSVKIISFFEGFCVPKDSANAQGEKWLKKYVIPAFVLDESEAQTLKTMIRYRYSVRDKYLHNGMRILVRRNEINTIMRYQRKFIHYIIGLNEDYETINEVLTFLKIIPNNNI